MFSRYDHKMKKLHVFLYPTMKHHSGAIPECNEKEQRNKDTHIRIKLFLFFRFFGALCRNSQRIKAENPGISMVEYVKQG